MGLTLPWLDVPALPPARMERVRRRAIFECFKWDPQVEDRPALASAPIVLARTAWSELARLSERLAAELAAAERELLGRPELLRRLGLPRALVRLWRDMPEHERPRGAARVVRFDFHATPAGWRISEANADVPGGFVEAGGVTALVHEQYPELDAPPDPSRVYALALARAAARESASAACVGLVHATSYTDDRQVMECLAQRLSELGVAARVLAPDALAWEDGVARSIDPVARDAGPAFGALARFYPAEWLPELARASGWTCFARGARTPLSNPATALVAQSKRLPLVWDELDAPLPTWRELLPETRDPRRARWRSEDGWVLKPALGRVGDGVVLAGVSSAKEARAARRSALLFPGLWIAQRRFDAVPQRTSEGARYPCLGVYTVDGRAAGAYGRVAPVPLIDWRAQDAAVLLEPALSEVRASA